MSESVFKHIGRRLKELYRDDIALISESFKSGSRDEGETPSEEFEVPVEGGAENSDEEQTLKEKLSSFVSVTRLSEARESRNDERIERELNELREGSYRVVRNERKQLSDEEQIDSILNFSDDAFTPELRVERIEDEDSEVSPSYEKTEDDPFSLILGEMDRAAEDKTT